MADIAARPQTPPPTTRLRTPDAPLHGAKFDDNGPISPRRSRRSTRNPYHTANGMRKSAAMTPPPQSSPPSPPKSPRTVRTKHTPEQQSRHHRGIDKLRPPQWDPRGVLLTPAKTPKAMTPPSTGVSRRLNFQLADPSHAMPTPRKLKKHARTDAFEEFGRSATEEIEIYTDWNAREPTRDESDDNPFTGLPTPRASVKKRQQKSPPRPLAANMTKTEMAQRVENDEGMIFTFRGKQVFRPYTDTVDTESAKALGYEPMTRSKDRPRRLSFGRRAITIATNDADEEAVTDIEGDIHPHDTITPSGSQTQAIAESTSPFDKWPRTKGRKREPDGIEIASTSKRLRNDL